MPSSKKRTKSKGLQPASVAREVKAGSPLTGVRITASAVAASVTAAENTLKSLGEAVCDRLEISKKKTVTQQVLVDTINKSVSRCSGLSSARASSGLGNKDKTKKDRRTIAIASAVRVFGRGCPLGRNNHQISESAKDSLSLITSDFLQGLGRDATRYVSTAGRKTIKVTDIAAAMETRRSLA